MGTGPGWTDEERVALYKIYLITSQDPVKGADQSGPTFLDCGGIGMEGVAGGTPWRPLAH